MRRYLLDTNSVADCIFRRRGVDEKVSHARSRGAKIGIGIPVLAELLAGIEYSDSREKNLAIVNRNLRLFRIWPFETTAAKTYARLFAGLRRKGQMIQSNDLMIAAIAITLGNCVDVTCDKDFDVIPELIVENWAQ